MLGASVVITTHDYERLLPQAIESALAQTHGSTEVVVVDDGSTDGTPAVVERYAGRIVAVRKENGGQASAFNAGVAVSGGALVCFLDADDLLDPPALERAAAEYEREPFAKAHWPLRDIDARGRALGTIDPPAPLDAGDLSARIARRGPGAYVTPPTSGNLFAREVLDAIGPVPEDLRICADGYLYELAPLYGRVADLGEPLGSLRRHGRRHFSNRRFEDRLASSVLVHEHLLGPLARRCAELGLEHDVAVWRERSWPLRSRRALDEVAEVVTGDAAWALLDGGRLGLAAGPDGHFLAFPPDPPEDVALHALERVRADGARFLVVAWPSFGWLERVPRFNARLRAAHRLVRATDRVLVFAL
jgi:glycosyltransferase involved in cell wall biosynthesis